MSISDPETSSLHEELSSALEASNSEPASPASPADPALAAAPVAPEFKIPEKWPGPAKEAVQAMLSLPDGSGRKWADSWLDHWKANQGYATRLEQERAQLRQQWDPISQVLAPVIPQWQLQGMSPDQGLRQLVGVAQMLAQNPKQGLQYVAQVYGVNLADLVEQQPYIAPEVSALQQQIQQMEQRWQQQQFYSQQQQTAAVYKSVNDQLKAFETATDASGQPKWPHYDRLQDHMAQLITGGMAQTLEDAYDKAFRLDTDLQKEQAQKQAQADAAKRAADAAKAVGASRTVKAKGTEGTPPGRTLRQELEAQFAARGMAT
jgi:hypothetical protein